MAGWSTRTRFSTVDVDPSSVLAAVEKRSREAVEAVEATAEAAGVAVETTVVRGVPPGREPSTRRTTTSTSS